MNIGYLVLVADSLCFLKIPCIPCFPCVFNGKFAKSPDFLGVSGFYLPLKNTVKSDALSDIV